MLLKGNPGKALRCVSCPDGLEFGRLLSAGLRLRQPQLTLPVGGGYYSLNPPVPPVLLLLPYCTSSQEHEEVKEGSTSPLLNHPLSFTSVPFIS